MLIEELHSRPSQAGYVYLMRNARGYYKIGHSINPRKRRAQLSSRKNLVKIMLLIPTHDMIALEIALQRRYALRKRDGEWYRLNKADLELIIRTYGAIRYNPLTFDWKTPPDHSAVR